MSLSNLGPTTQRYGKWLHNGGPTKVGLSRSKNYELNGALSDFVADAGELTRELSAALKVWRDLSTNGSAGPNVVQANLGLILTHLAAADDDLAETTRSAGRLSNAAVSAQASVKRLMQEDEEARTRIDASLKALKSRYDVQVVILANARKELSGDKGFLNGFLTGLTLGIHNPVKQNMDAAKAAMRAINASVVQHNAQHKELTQRIQEIRYGTEAMAALRHVPQAMVVVRNRVNAATKAVKPAYDEMERTEGKRERVIKIYLRRASKKMQDLEAAAANLQQLG